MTPDAPNVESLRVELLAVCKRHYEKARLGNATNGPRVSHGILTAEHVIRGAAADPGTDPRVWFDALLRSLDGASAGLDDPSDTDGSALGGLRTIVREAQALRDRTFKLGKHQGTFWGGFVGGFLFGLWGLLICYFLGKPATKSGAGYGFLSRFGIAFIAIFFAVALNDPHANLPNWTTEHSPAGFRVDLPGAPETERISTDVTGSRFLVERSDSFSEAGWFDLPGGESEVDVERVFSSVAASEAEARGTTIRSSEPVPFGENPGRIFQFETPDGATCRYRFGAVNHRYVYALACGYASQTSLVNRVTDSLAPE